MVLVQSGVQAVQPSSCPDPTLSRLVGIYEICGTAFAFAALKHDGTVLTWWLGGCWGHFMSELDSLEIEDVHDEFEAYGGDPGACKAQLAAGKAGSGVFQKS